ncbi:hypothetical protein HWV62_45310 [Athelia sp. TMB]|nr:hypothetical protein HWV62_45310 [Athelia sp. TMB]
MSTLSKRARTNSTESDAIGQPRKIPRLEDADVSGDRVADIPEATESRAMGHTLNVIGTSGSASVTMFAGDYVVYPTAVQYHNKKREIHTWLKAPDTSLSYNAARKKYQAGTGSWFLDGSQFSQWKERPGSVLWLYGGPGCGKTILCSSAIENVINSCKSRPSARGYAYIFFDGTMAQSDTIDYSKFTRSIIKQLSSRCGTMIPDALIEMYHACDDGDCQPSESQLERTLLRVLETFESTYILIDSLDECVEKADLLRWIQNVTSVSSGRLHLMLTSRPEPDIEHGLGSLSSVDKIQIGDETMTGDISAYLDARLQSAEMVKWKEPEKREIKRTLVDGSGGMFRWVVLQMDDVKKCFNKAELFLRLKTLPRGLDETYAKLFERSEHKEALIILLQWLVFSERPMTVEILAEVLAVDFNRSGGPAYNPNKRYERPADILRICYGLITEFQGTVKLAHFSVKEYFIKHITNEQLSHSVIAQTCLAQLLYFDGPEILDWEHPRSLSLNYIDTLFPLAGYAALNWVSHLHSSGAAPVQCPLLRQLLQQLFTSPTTWNHALLSWVQIQNLIIKDNYYDLSSKSNVLGRSLQSFKNTQNLPLDASPLYYACFVGSVQAVQHLINNNADVDIRGREASTRPLLIASEEGHLEIARLLLDKGANVDIVGGKYSTALQAACARGHLELATLLLDKGANVDVVGGKYGTALQAACARGQLELATLLLDKGADVDAEGGHYGTALQAACARGYLELATLLLDKGADVEVVGGFYGTALQAACAGGHLELATLLLDKGANVDVVEGKYGTALQAACAGGHLELATLLLDKGANVDVVGGVDGTALQAACAGGHLELATLLLDKGINVDAEGAFHGTALQAACGGGHLELATLLLDKGANVDVVGGEHSTALLAACVGGHLEVTTLLLDKGADIDVEGWYYGTALHAACAEGHLQLATLLLDKGADVDVVGGHYGTALHAACAEGHLELATLLLDKGADVDVVGGHYGTALQAACASGHLELATLLLDKGANVAVEGGFYGTALQAACAGGHLEIALLLLDKGANVDVVEGEYSTALQAACMRGHLELATLLLDKGASVDVEGGHYGTALQAACADGHLELATLLLDKGANVDVKGGRYGTALQAACAEGHLELATLLLDKGANVDVVGGYYRTALQAACAGSHLELATLLLDKGANVDIVGGSYGTALQAACARGHRELTTLLLDRGANVDVVGGRYGTALQTACTWGRREIAELLRERGAVEHP